MSFEKELENGKFYIPECTVCKKLVWPPSEFCDKCNGEISLKKEEFEGKIIEFSRQSEEYFCIVEFCDSVRIMAKMNTCPKKDQTVKILKCGIKDGSYYFHIN
jgi:uncharacterized protein|tara:strand:+ start:307 stop:615 length:309 start_codon:yes stop_codon:yes gene_type:complete